MFINYAHRGASDYMPESTVSAFLLGIYHHANGIETDVRLSRDGVPVLFHDATLERVCGVTGTTHDYTSAELQKMFVSNAESGEKDRILTLEEFLRLIAFRDLNYAIEIKEPGIAGAVLSRLSRVKIKDKTVITAFEYDILTEVRSLGDYKTGWLKRDFSEDDLNSARKIGITQLCPHASAVTKEKIAEWHIQGYNVRAWGVTDPDIMKCVYDSGVDGMTVNFPDLLHEYISSLSDDVFSYLK